MQQQKILKWHNWKIGVRLVISFLLIVTITVGVFSINKMNLLSGYILKLYKHPFVVNNTILKVEKVKSRNREHSDRIQSFNKSKKYK